METKKICVLPGDGIGPEVMEEALKVLEVVSGKYGFAYELKRGFIGGAAYDEYDTPLPEETLALCGESDAVLLGSVGGPKWDDLPPEMRPELGGLLGLRKALKLYANIRPVVLFDSLKDQSPLAFSRLQGAVDLVTVRELSSGIYYGMPRGREEGEGFDTMRYRRDEVARIARAAFKLAQHRRNKVMSVDKANVLHSSMLWREVVAQVAEEFPGVELGHMYVDNAAMQLILNPGQFDVILTTNIFGDILSDESAAICGSLGLLPSASLGETIHLYEPAGGSAPDIAGQNMANPLAQILSVALMMDYSFDRPEIRRDIYAAVNDLLRDGARTADINSSAHLEGCLCTDAFSEEPLTTSEMGALVRQRLEAI